MRFEVTIDATRTRTGRALASLLEPLLIRHGRVVEVSGPLPISRLRAQYTVQAPLKPKERPRLGKGRRVYTPRTTLVSQAQIAQGYTGCYRGGPDAHSLFQVRIVAAHTDRYRRDVDNLSKTVLDGLNGVAWADDSQVVSLSVSKGLDPRQAWTRVQIFTLT